MGQLEVLKKERLTTRTITVESFAVDEGRIIIEGSLEDRRHIEAYTSLNKKLPAGPIHVMVIRFLVGEIPPRILDVEFDLPRVPIEECSDAAHSLKDLAGLPLAYGFSKEVKKRLGGTKGCVHLTSLVLAMGAAALQGWATHNRREKLSAEVQGYINAYIKDSCHVWRAEGKSYRESQEALKGSE